MAEQEIDMENRISWTKTPWKKATQFKGGADDSRFSGKDKALYQKQKSKLSYLHSRGSNLGLSAIEERWEKHNLVRSSTGDWQSQYGGAQAIGTEYRYSGLEVDQSVYKKLSTLETQARQLYTNSFFQ